MSLAKTGYADSVTGRATEKVNLNENGNIAQSGEAVAGTKNFGINGLNSGNSFTTNHNVLKAFMDLAKGTTDSQSNKFTVSWEVA